MDTAVDDSSNSALPLPQISSKFNPFDQSITLSFSLDLETELLQPTYYLPHYNHVSSALGVFGDTSDALATPVVSH
jgi:hypothetical protein